MAIWILSIVLMARCPAEVALLTAAEPCEMTNPGGSVSVRVRKDVPPLGSPFLTSGTPSGWVFECQTYSCWVSYFHFEPLPMGNICKIFKFNHSFGVICVQI